MDGGMIERVADAIYKRLDQDEDRQYPLSALTRSVGEDTGFPGYCYLDGYIRLEDIARAAIEAMREPPSPDKP